VVVSESVRTRVPVRMMARDYTGGFCRHNSRGRKKQKETSELLQVQRAGGVRAAAPMRRSITRAPCGTVIVVSSFAAAAPVTMDFTSSVAVDVRKGFDDLRRERLLVVGLKRTGPTRRRRATAPPTDQPHRECDAGAAALAHRGRHCIEDF